MFGYMTQQGLTEAPGSHLWEWKTQGVRALEQCDHNVQRLAAREGGVQLTAAAFMYP